LRFCVFAFLRFCVFAFLRFCVFAFLRFCVFAFLRFCVFAFFHCLDVKGEGEGEGYLALKCALVSPHVWRLLYDLRFLIESPHVQSILRRVGASPPDSSLRQAPSVKRLALSA